MPTVPDAHLLRQFAFADVAARVPGQLHVLEIGTARCSKSWAEYSDGWSTKYWAEYASRCNGHVWSIDNDKAAITASRQIVPKELHRYVSWFCNEGPGDLIVKGRCPRANVIYLDAGADPVLTLQHLSLALWVAAPKVWVLLDDTHPHMNLSAGKATHVLTLAERNHWERIDYTTAGRQQMTLVIRDV